jgi:hypothetical protein
LRSRCTIPRECLVERNGAGGETLRQVHALDQFHHQQPLPADLLDLVDAGDVGMVEGCQHLGFAPEARQPLRVGCHRLRQHLDRYLATQLGVFRSVHLSHTALA